MGYGTGRIEMRRLAMIIVPILLGGCGNSGGTQERVGVVTLKGSPVTLVGPKLAVGTEAPPFTALDAGFKKVALSGFAGRPVLISAVPSLDTGICSLQTVRFNEALAKLPKKVALLTISRDLPFAQKRFCSAKGIDKTVVLSDAALQEFGVAYGVLMKETGLLARSVFVLDSGGRITYIEIVPEVATHPDYAAALAAIRRAAQ